MLVGIQQNPRTNHDYNSCETLEYRLYKKIRKVLNPGKLAAFKGKASVESSFGKIQPSNSQQPGGHGMAFFLVIHIIGVAIAAICAGCEIESITFSGPFLSAYGLSIAIWAYRKNRVLTLYYALATPTVSVVCFVLIFGMKLSPERARFPIGVLIIMFFVINTFLGAAANCEIAGPRIAGRPKRPFQYSIASIMGLTLVVALSLSLTKTLGEGGIALAVLLCYLSLCVWILRRFHRYQQ